MEKLSNIIPDEFKALRACLRCGLVKTFIQASNFLTLGDLNLKAPPFFNSLTKQDVIIVTS